MRRHDNEMNLQTDKRPGGSQHDMGWRARRTSSLLPVAGEVFLLTLPCSENNSFYAAAALKMTVSMPLFAEA
jgi:hypothetical protein